MAVRLTGELLLSSILVVVAARSRDICRDKESPSRVFPFEVAEPAQHFLSQLFGLNT